ncbi:MAG: phasin family protein [Deltaproteobacteria bacterium]|nr:phasin family protein [Deltaproteobacteria bacterium]
MVAEISDRIRDRFHTAKNQIEEVQDKVVHSFTDVREQVRDQVNDVPKELRGAWARVVARLWSALDVPSRRDFNALVRRVDALDRRLGKGTKKTTAKRSRS